MDGIIIIDKPKGYTSHDVVNVVRKNLKTTKVGHTGTLDPNATGVLPVLIGKATKISKYLIEHDKTYIAELTLGKKSSTGDIEGEIIEEKEVPNLSEEQIKNTLASFLGKQMQTPPIYSSIKINGKKAYEYARSGQTVEIPSREIEITEISLLSFEKDSIIFKVSCSKGTYIRVLCEDIAKKLGTVGLMQNLRRTRVDKFDIKDACLLENLDKAKIISIEECFKDFPSINLDDKQTMAFLNGVKIKENQENGIYSVYNKNKYLGLGIIENKSLKRDVIVIDN